MRCALCFDTERGRKRCPRLLHAVQFRHRRGGVVPPEIAKKLPRYPLIPATLLGRLAVNERHHREGIGEFLLMDALHRSRAQSGQIAAVAVVVEAIDERAERFYQHFGFLPFPTITGRLFIMMKTVKQLFA